MVHEKMSVVWLPGREEGQLIALTKCGIIWPHIGGRPPEIGISTYSAPPKVGTCEQVVVLPSGNGFLAYPVGSNIIPVPGVNDPVALRWVKNQRGSGVVAMIEVLNLGTVPVFPADNARFISTTPWPERTREWPEEPKEGQIGPCYLSWRTTERGTFVAYGCSSLVAANVSAEQMSEWYGVEYRYEILTDGSLVVSTRTSR